MRQVIVVCALLALSACASTPPTQVAEQQAAGKACLRETGTRIKREPQEGCIAAPGRVHTAQELERSGALSVEEALRRLGAR